MESTSTTYIFPAREAKAFTFMMSQPLLCTEHLFVLAWCYFAEVIDHYDERNNEHKYESFTNMFKSFGWALFIASIAAQIFFGKQKGW
jgi:hypothetical protein